MAFVSQMSESKKSGRRGSAAEIVVSQTYKPSTKSEELSIRIATSLLKKVGMDIGSKVDVLFDAQSERWMVKKVGSEGFSISGKPGAPTGLIRYTLKKGHKKLTDVRSSLPVKLDGDSSSFELHQSESAIVFQLRKMTPPPPPPPQYPTSGNE